jgi:GR25 family glycosyltransferase involved in LPS biosynthesis
VRGQGQPREVADENNGKPWIAAMAATPRGPPRAARVAAVVAQDRRRSDRRARAVMSADLPAFVIHLARAEARRANVARLQAVLPGPVEVFPAVDGRTLSADARARAVASGPLHAPVYPFDLQPGEIGVFLSFRAIWSHMVASGLECALIFEDDVAVEPDIFLPALELARERIDALGYVQFQVRPVSGPAEVVAERDGVRLLRPRLAPLRMSAQLVGSAAARRLLAATERFDRPVDTTLQLHWKTGQRICCAVPSGVRDLTRESGGSTIQSRPPLSRKLWREWARFRYRRALSRAAG